MFGLQLEFSHLPTGAEFLPSMAFHGQLDLQMLPARHSEQMARCQHACWALQHLHQRGSTPDSGNRGARHPDLTPDGGYDEDIPEIAMFHWGKAVF